MAKKPHQVNVRFDDDLYNWIKTKASEAGIDVSEIVRLAVADYKTSQDLFQISPLQMSKLKDSDRFFFVAEKNNGTLVLRQVRRELVNLTEDKNGR